MYFRKDEFYKFVNSLKASKNYHYIKPNMFGGYGDFPLILFNILSALFLIVFLMSRTIIVAEFHAQSWTPTPAKIVEFFETCVPYREMRRGRLAYAKETTCLAAQDFVHAHPEHEWKISIRQNAKIIYSVNDQQIETRIPFGSDYLTVGQEILVYYDPENPTKFDWARSRQWQMSKIYVIMFMIAVAYAVVYLYRRSSERKYDAFLRHLANDPEAAVRHLMTRKEKGIIDGAQFDREFSALKKHLGRTGSTA